MMYSYIKISILLAFCFWGIKAKSQEKQEEVIIDPVCGKKVDRSESFDWKYAGKIYYFHSYDCRYSFKMNPQNYLTKNCVTDMTAIDPVCGMKVNKSECYDTKYNKVKYHFCSFECRETFKTNPKKFTDNKCAAPADSLHAGQ